MAKNGLTAIHDDSIELSEQEIAQVILGSQTTLWRKLSAVQRESAFRYIKANRLAEEAKMLGFRMLLEDKQPGMLELKRIGEIAAEIKDKLMDNIGPYSSTLPPPPAAPPKIVPAIPDLKVQEEPKMRRLLQHKEATMRFHRLGINIRQTCTNFADFYFSVRHSPYIGYPEHLPMPEITDVAMSAIENAFYEGTVDRIMVDDARAGDGTTLKSFQPNTKPEKVKEYDETGHEHGLRFSMHLPVLRYVAYSSTNLQQWNMPNLHKQPSSSFMGLGTFTRLVYFLLESDQQALQEFSSGLCKFGEMEPEVMLNTVTMDNRYLAARLHSIHDTELLSVRVGPKINPAWAGQQVRPVYIIQSDL